MVCVHRICQSGGSGGGLSVGRTEPITGDLKNVAEG